MLEDAALPNCGVPASADAAVATQSRSSAHPLPRLQLRRACTQALCSGSLARRERFPALFTQSCCPSAAHTLVLCIFLQAVSVAGGCDGQWHAWRAAPLRFCHRCINWWDTLGSCGHAPADDGTAAALRGGVPDGGGPRGTEEVGGRAGIGAAASCLAFIATDSAPLDCRSDDDTSVMSRLDAASETVQHHTQTHEPKHGYAQCCPRHPRRWASL